MQNVSTRVFLSLSLAGLAMTMPIANAASQCKTLTQDACAAEPTCAWVNGYTRKDGREVKAYCRNAARKQSGQQTSVPMKKSDKPEKSS